MEYGQALQREDTPIPGLSLWTLPVHGDNRGWFKENWQREKMIALGLADFGPVQNNISFNTDTGTTRGIHAEPWDKWVSVAHGRIFGAWVDLREGPTFGATFTAEIDPARAIFVPRGVGNAFQTLEPNTAYSYLVNDHWSAEAEYTFLNLEDETVAIPWPLPLEPGNLSAKDRNHPRLQDVRPVSTKKTLVVGASGQLGLALRAEFAARPQVEFASRNDFDITADGLEQARPWGQYDTIINAAAFTAVDAAETDAGRREAWSANVTAVQRLAKVANAHRLTLVHVSSDYVFDGNISRPYTEDDPVSPLGVYGQTKAAADAVLSTVHRHYIVRSSWVIGDGANFVRTMARLAAAHKNPDVVNDQFGRLTFTADLARGIRHLLGSRAPYGTYNLTGGGGTASWAEIAAIVFTETGHHPGRVRGVSTAQYFANATGLVAPRPRNSVLDLAKIEKSGFAPSPWRESLTDYLRSL